MFGCFFYPMEFVGYPGIFWFHTYLTLSTLSWGQVFYMGPSAPLCHPERFSSIWPFDPKALEPTFSLPSKDALQSIPRVDIEDDFFEPLVDKFKSPYLALGFLRYSPYPPLTDKFIREIEKLHGRYGDIDAIFSWQQCPSLRDAGERLGIPIIFHEYAPFRSPYFHTMFYFDSKGLMFEHDIHSRYEEFIKTGGGAAALLSKKQLLELLVRPAHQAFFAAQQVEEYDIGIVMDWELFHCQLGDAIEGAQYANEDLISYARYCYPNLKLLLRRKFGSLLQYAGTLPNVDIDSSPDSIHFIKKCKSFVSIGSNLILEAIMMDKPVHIIDKNNLFRFLGESHEKSSINNEDLLKRLNYFIFGYLVPRELVYDQDYLKWRLTGPCELDIFRIQRKYFLCNVAMGKKYRAGDFRNFLLESGARESDGNLLDDTSLMEQYRNAMMYLTKETLRCELTQLHAKVSCVQQELHTQFSLLRQLQDEIRGLRDAAGRWALYLRYQRYRLLSQVLWGATRARYNEKRGILKRRLAGAIR